MTRIIWSMSVSLDGFMEGPNREIDWHRVDAELHAHMNEWLGAMGGFLEGRVSFELMAEFWPTADADPDASAEVVAFAKIWRDMPKVVYSTTLERGDGTTTIVRAVVAEEVEALKATAAGDLVVGGADLAAAFLQLGLIDEIRVYVHPVLIGQGKPMFPADAGVDLQLVEARRFGNGVVLLRYGVGAGVPGPS